MNLEEMLEAAEAGQGHLVIRERSDHPGVFTLHLSDESLLRSVVIDDAEKDRIVDRLGAHRAVSLVRARH